MPIVDAVVECEVNAESFRVRQVAGMFDVPLEGCSTERFRAEVPGLDEEWQIGAIVGPSGSGKSTIARRAFGDHLYTGSDWPGGRAVVDVFPPRLSIKQITQALTAVGFSSPPAWLKPYAVLSNGEKFRCDLARALLREKKGDGDIFHSYLVFDEFTSVVDRTVARIGSAAVAKTIRSNHVAARRFVAVTCHYDVLDWLEPDWVLDMATGKLARGRLQWRRPPIRLSIRRVHGREVWPLFKRHHYLSAALHPSAACFAGFIEIEGGADVPICQSGDREEGVPHPTPATFTAVLYFPHPVRPGYKEHRTVCLPDFQGIGLGSAMSEFIASVYRATGKPYYSTTGHPGLMHHRCRSPLWRMTRKPATGTCPHGGAGVLGRGGSVGRMTAGFEYVGPARGADAGRLGIPAGI